MNGKENCSQFKFLNSAG